MVTGDQTVNAAAGANASNLRKRLDFARRELLDLSTRNRLLHTPRRQARSSVVDVIGEHSGQVHQMLVIDGKSMAFEAAPDEVEASTAHGEPEEARVRVAASNGPAPESTAQFSDVDGSPTAVALEPAAPADLPQPEEDADAEDRGPRQRDDCLQAALPSNQLQHRLLRTYYAARTYEEEQGVNVLFLAIGFLKWFEPDKPEKERFAPLLLVPLELERQSAASRFRIRWTGEDLATNLSLQVKLKTEFGIGLPDIAAAEDEEGKLCPARYFDLVRQVTAGEKHWQVLDDDIALGFFSFAKLLMYRDLDPSAWPEARSLDRHPILSPLLGQTGAAFADDPPLCREDELIDPLIDPLDMMHVVDADSSQSIVIEEAKRGRNLVIQGPPGTGKSQTIANIIAAAVKNGQRVLFVAEKVAALNVVKDRLSNIGLGDMCLAQHSNKARKAAVLQDLGHTLALDKPVVNGVEQTASQLKDTRDRLNQHVRMMHTPHQPSGVTPYRCVGELIRLRAAGVPTSDFVIAQCATWPADQSRERRDMLKELAAFVSEIGVPAQHPWRGVMLPAILPQDADRLREALPGAIAAARQAQTAAANLSQTLGQSTANPTTLAVSRGLARAAQRIAQAPEMDRAALADRVWDTDRTEIAQLVADGVKWSETRARLANTIIESAWTTDLSQTRRDMAAHGEGLFRFLSGAFRRAKNNLASIMAAGATIPSSLHERLALIDSIIAAQAAQKAIAASNEIGRRTFGELWRDERSNWSALVAIDHWEADCRRDDRMPRDFRQIAARVVNPQALVERAQQALAASDRAQTATSEVFGAVQLDVPIAFALDTSAPAAVAPLERIVLADIIARLEAWGGNLEGITKWIAYRARDEQSRTAGLNEVCDRLRDGRIAPVQTIDRFDNASFEGLMRVHARANPALGVFDGLSHERLLQQFRELDQQRINLARSEVALAHWQRLPRGVAGVAIGEVGAIRRELNKKRRHLPIRQLIKNAGNAVQAIKPVFMMSPMSIAQYIEPGALEFDVLLFDEASQVRPVDALGAIARARQIIVVGDDKQLPPTRFFTREFEGDIEGDDGEASATGDLESILGLCASHVLPQRMLRWHYRSRHHSLIAVSNREFYDSRLYVIPSPMERDATRGVVFHHIRDGVFDRGASATNCVEAKVLAEAVMRHAHKNASLSLGVGAFSVQQRDAIIDELERMRREQPETESFFATDTAEPFFVKNLENIQGDERDVIFISVGYARDARGAMSMNFGPLSNQGGERRLNVLITRAKTRCEVFSSITADDSDLGRATGRGPQALKAYLEYAQRGTLEGGAARDEGENAMFERTLAAALGDSGWKVDQRVGVAGFFVDLAVRDSQRADEYLLGIECDGPLYAASRSARDRDKTRPFVLADRGWRMQRVWSLDYFNRPEEQLRRVLGALQHIGAPAQAAGAAVTAPTMRDEGVEREEASRRPARGAEDVSIAVPYAQARFRVPTTREIPDVPVDRLAAIIAKIIDIEGPIHSDEIAERVRQLWDAGRLGPRMVRAIDVALEWAVRTSQAYRIASGDFYQRATDTPIVVRDRSEVESSGLRAPEMLPPAEICECVLRILRAQFGASRDETITAVVRTLGFKTTTPALRDTIDRQISDLLKATAIVEDNGRLRAS